jgi:hypothetical protein
MRLFRSATYITVITFAALLYVHQHVELLKLSYTIEYKEKTLKEMLDRRGSLGYNINNLEAPSRLENVLSARKVDLVFPKRLQIFKIPSAAYGLKGTESVLRMGLENKFNIFGILEFLGPRAEAHAREK